MPDVTEQLRRYGEAVEEVVFRGSGGWDELGVLPRSRGWRWPAAAAVVLLVGIAAASVVPWGDDSGDDGVEVDTAGETGGSLFGSPTDAVLVFSDGSDGVLALDVDAGVAARRVLEGERAGDQPFRLTVVDNELVVGWGEIHAVPLDGSDPHLVTEATTYVPAAEPGEIWAFDYSGGRLGAGDLTLRRVDLIGNVTFSTDDFDTGRGWPLLGVPGGVALATDSGIAVWDAATGHTGETFGSERPAAAASDGSRLAWCEQGCSIVRTVELGKRGPATAQHWSTDQAPRFSPDGRHLAFTVEETNGVAVKLRDLETGTDTIVADAMSGPVALQWDPRGQQLFFTGTQPDGTITKVGRHDSGSGTTAIAELSLQGQLATGAFIVLPRSEAGVLLSDELSDSGTCAPPTVFPSDRDGVCAFPVESTRSTPPSTNGNDTGLSEARREAAENLVADFLDALRVEDLEAAAALWAGYPDTDVEDVAARIDHLSSVLGDPLLQAILDEPAVVYVTPSWGASPVPVVTVATAGTDQQFAATFTLTDGREEPLIQRLPLRAAAMEGLQPLNGLAVRAGDTVRIPMRPVEGGATVHLDGELVASAVAPEDGVVEFRVPEQVIGPTVVTVSVATPEFPAAAAFVLTVEASTSVDPESPNDVPLVAGQIALDSIPDHGACAGPNGDEPDRRSVDIESTERFPTPEEALAAFVADPTAFAGSSGLQGWFGMTPRAGWVEGTLLDEADLRFYLSQGAIDQAEQPNTWAAVLMVHRAEDGWALGRYRASTC